VKILLALSINVLLLALTFLYLTHTFFAVLIGITLIVWFFYFLWHRQNQVEKRVEEKIRGQNIIMPIEHIMFRAVESSGYSQTSGMGYIALTDDYLYFELVLLDLEITIPTKNITGAEFVRRLKGVSPVRKMLRIMYTNRQGDDDSMAINVKDMEQWKDVISNVSRTISKR